MALLEVRNLQVNYGPIQAVKGIDLDVEKGTLVALLGANGAGKTTTLRAITGMVKAYGSVHLGETEILGQRGYKTARMGVNMSPEGRLIFAGLTVEENLKAGAYCIKSAKQYQKNMDRVQELFPILKERRRQQAGTLSGGEQQMLAIGRALMADPEILLLDEPSLGLAPLIIFVQALQAVDKAGLELNYANFAKIMEETEFSIPMGGTISYAGGDRLGVTALALNCVSLSKNDAGVYALTPVSPIMSLADVVAATK